MEEMVFNLADNHFFFNDVEVRKTLRVLCFMVFTGGFVSRIVIKCTSMTFLRTIMAKICLRTTLAPMAFMRQPLAREIFVWRPGFEGESIGCGNWRFGTEKSKTRTITIGIGKCRPSKIDYFVCQWIFVRLGTAWGAYWGCPNGNIGCICGLTLRTSPIIG